MDGFIMEHPLKIDDLGVPSGKHTKSIKKLLEMAIGKVDLH